VTNFQKEQQQKILSLLSFLLLAIRAAHLVYNVQSARGGNKNKFAADNPSADEINAESRERLKGLSTKWTICLHLLI
jgi:hypothetical protein